jgi:hypothetical protein
MRTGDPEFSNPPGPQREQITHLLTETDPRSRVEREEDEWVRNEVLAHPLVQETVRVEFQGYPPRELSSALSALGERRGSAYHPAPIDLFCDALRTQSTNTLYQLG